MIPPALRPHDVAAMAERLVEGAAAIALPLERAAAGRVARYGALLLRWNRRINLLSSRVDPEALVERHLLDSLALLRVLRPAGDVLDVGAGAGLPSLPLRLVVPEQRLVLLEPAARRAALLRAALRELALDGVEVRPRRLEDLPAARRFDLLLSRATFAPDEWIGRAVPHLAADGRLVVMLGRRERLPVEATARREGLRVVAQDDLTLPWSGARRRNLILGR